MNTGIKKWLIVVIVLIGKPLNWVLMLVVSVPYRAWLAVRKKQPFWEWANRMAEQESQTANVHHDAILNRFFWGSCGPQSGDKDEPVSSVAGKRLRDGWPMKKPGRWLADWLNRIDPGHTDDSIEDEEGVIGRAS